MCVNDVNGNFYHLYNGPYCICLEYTTGKPPNCRFNCKGNDKFCAINEYCDLDGNCKEGCRYESCVCRCDSEVQCCLCETKDCICKFDEFCEFSTKTCKIGCRSHAYCSSNHYCDENLKKCVPGCWTDYGCKSSEYCDKFTHECTIGCRMDGSCGRENHCDGVSRKCKSGCFASADCKFEDKSKDEICYDFYDLVQNESGCFDDEVCDPQTLNCLSICEDEGFSSCPDGEYCDIFNTKLCRPGCNSHGNCKINEHCNFEKEKCESGCYISSNCENDKYCDQASNECKSGCDDDVQCPNYQVCKNDIHQCGKGCRSSYECQYDQYCDRKTKECIGICSNSTCGPNSICSLIDGDQYCSCKSDFIPKAGVGCILTKNSTVSTNDNLDCSLHCGFNADCKLINENVHCYCTETSRYPENSFLDCLFYKMPGFSSIEKPDINHVALNCASIAALCSG